MLLAFYGDGTQVYTHTTTIKDKVTLFKKNNCLIGYLKTQQILNICYLALCRTSLVLTYLRLTFVAYVSSSVSSSFFCLLSNISVCGLYHSLFIDQ